MSVLLHDIRFALRMLARTPAFTVTVVLTLALGIGVNTAIFSVVNGVLLRPLPYSDPDGLVVLWSHFPGRNVHEETLSPGMYFQIRDQSHIFDEVAIVRSHSLTLTGAGTPERVRGMSASASCLSMLGAEPELGRLFAAGEDEPGRPRTIVLSHALWERRFGGDPDVIGSLLRLDDQSYTIIGVLEPSFPDTRAYLPKSYDPGTRIDYWIPLVLGQADRQQHGRQNFGVLARLKRGVALADARAGMDLLAGRMRQAHPEHYPPGSGFAVDVVPMLEPIVREVRPALRLLTGAAGLVLLIACANVAGLLLARATSRRKEIGMRMALGAGRMRIVRQLLTESVLLSLLGGGAGLLAACWGTSGLLAIGVETIPRIGEIGVDASVVAFTLALSMVTAVAFGLAPAWIVSRADVSSAVREAGGSVMGAGSLLRRRWSARRFLAVSELGLAVVLLIGAGLLVHSFWKLRTVDPGFSVENVLTFQLPENRDYENDMDGYRRFYEALGERLAALPGVESVGGMSVLPLAPGESFAPVEVEGGVPGPDETELKADARTVLWDYFQTMRIPLIAGRCFDDRDTIDSPPVAIVDETFAERAWPGESPIGKRIRDPAFDGSLPWLTVVGVVGAVKRGDLESDAQMTYYQPYAQWAQQWMYVAVRTSSDPDAFVSSVSGEVWALEKDLPLLRIATMEQRIADTLARRRFSLYLLEAFAVMALVLAIAGLYGVVAYMVGRSTREIGIRMALGAQRSDVLRVVLGNGLMLTGIGLAVGLAVSLAVTHAMKSLLYEVRPIDPITFIVVPLLLAAAALLACYIPARRATKVDPADALRHE